MSHTPGPWRFEVGTPFHGPCVHFGRASGGIMLAKDAPNANENACLMAAAPEMFEALKLVDELWDGDEGFLEEAKACEELGANSPVFIVWKKIRAAMQKAKEGLQ